MNKTFPFQDERAYFVCFNEYEGEDQFDEFLELLARKLGVTPLDKAQHPYSVTAGLQYKGKSAIAMWHDELGCCLRFDLADQQLAQEVMAITGS